ncbi:ankyrin repeats (3 copies) domain-containing protein [Sarocladium implicatum]|nr:ankyrin repeats (3 copies) domain-containing protein [Sarocladium implicatum]
MASQTMPELPAPVASLPKYIAQNPDKPMVDLIEPYRQYEAYLRTVYAQDRQNPMLNDPHLNVVPLFTEDTKHITTRARNLAAESDEEKSKYIMALPDDKRRPHGSPATVASIDEFRKNFNLFSESSMVDMDWSNVVAAGSSVVNTLLPVPKEFNTTKRKLREYYHEKFCPASDVDLFLYGLTHDQAIEKIKQIERAVKDALLSEVTVVRTKYALTIASQYPVRHVQIVLRVYKSVSEILTGFDIDAAGGAYDGKQVYVTPRALGSFITQINHIDLTRRSPSYENRLSKYSHRNFEVYWPELNRSRIDPTIFERSFQRTLGLARLLILERLPSSTARDEYMNKRREERGRPQVYRNFFGLHGDIKERHEDEVPDWLSEEEISNYHTFTVPYGPKHNAKRIEKLVYQRDLLLNAEWNQPDDRTVYLHRHPAFFGRVEDVVEDCCGSCPIPHTEEEKEVAEKEAEIYISGKVRFMIDDPGRQQIGSFNPLTEQDWTDMAYVGNTARLCQSIVDGDVGDVVDWLSQEDADPNKRDYTGRAPIHLAAMTSTPEVVKALIDRGARITARIADGRTALHIAAARGDTAIIKLLMDKSMENEEAEEEKQAAKRKAAKSTVSGAKQSGSDGDSDAELIDDDETETDARSMATGSFVKITKEDGDDPMSDELALEEADEEPDFYNVDVLAWDVPCSPLHLAIANGHEDAVKALCDHGADSILPVKFISKNTNRYDYGQSGPGAILTLALALTLPPDQAKSMARLLLRLGATASQADSDGCTAFQRYVEKAETDAMDVLISDDKTGVKNAINHLIIRGSWMPETIAPLHTAIDRGDSIMVLQLLNNGAHPNIDFDTWLKAVKVSRENPNFLGSLEQNKQKYQESVEQPIVAALRTGNAELVLELLKRGADPNVMTRDTAQAMSNEYRQRYTVGRLALDVVRGLLHRLSTLRLQRANSHVSPPTLPIGLDDTLKRYETGSYQHWLVAEAVDTLKEDHEKQMKGLPKKVEQAKKTAHEYEEAVDELVSRLEEVEKTLKSHGAKRFIEMYPDLRFKKDDSYGEPQVQNSKDDKKPWTYTFTFVGENDINEKRHEGYIKLFEAAWSGDLERIKALTTGAWGPHQDQPPLMAAIRDIVNNTPFSLAFLRGHYDVARAILEIVKAQWTPIEKDKVRYTMESRRGDEDSDDSDAYSDDSDSDAEPRIISQKVDQQYTIDDLGKVSMNVKSHTKPLQTLTQRVMTFDVISATDIPRRGVNCLFDYCIEADKVAALKFLLELAATHTGQKLDGEDIEEECNFKTFTFPQPAFHKAILRNRTQILSLIIKKTGAGIPLDDLVKKSGGEFKEKPRYYQGLSVYGKKRNDWATAGRGMVTRTSGDRTAPLLRAALGGAMESVEYFLSDAPHRHYSEFGKSRAAREDPRLKHLKDSPGGFDRAIAKWLGADNDLIIHCAVIAEPSKEARELLEYLTETAPGALEKRDSDGNTPLLSACILGRHEAIKILLAANADQTAKNHKGENVLHALLQTQTKSHRLRATLELFDQELLKNHLFQQRKNLQHNGNTPIHSWISKAVGISEDSFTAPQRYHYHHQSRSTSAMGSTSTLRTTLQLLLKFTSGKELELLNGAGDTPLHTAIMKDNLAIANTLIEHRPELMFRENAVGRTPFEIAQARVSQKQFKRPETRNQGGSNQTADNMLEKVREEKKSSGEDTEMTEEGMFKKLGLSREYEQKDYKPIQSELGVYRGPGLSKHLDTDMLPTVMLDLCTTAMEQHPAKRRLVSLNEANDVAKRLGEHFIAKRYFTVQSRVEDDDAASNDGETAKEVKSDVVTMERSASRAWYRWSSDWTGNDDGYFEKCGTCGDYHEGA